MSDNIEIGTAYVNILPSMRGTEAAINRELGHVDLTPSGEKMGAKMGDGAAKKAGSRIKSGLKTAGAAAGAGAAAAFAGAFAIGGKSLEAYAEYEQLVGGVDTLFKDSSETLQEYAAQAYQTAGMSANTYMSTVTSFSAALTKSLGGDTAKAANYADMAVRDMADNANKMGTSIETIQETYSSLARGNYAMLDNLKLGYGGTKEGLKALLADAEKFQAAQGNMVDYSVDSYADIVEAIHVVQNEMGITGTTALEASETITGSVQAAKAAWENWLVGLANEDADMNELTDQLVQSIATAAENVIPRAGVIVTTLGAVLQDELVEMLRGLITQLRGNGPEMADAALEMLLGIVTAINEVITLAVDAMLLMAASMIVALAEKAGEVGAEAWEFAKAVFDEIKRGFTEGWNSKVKPGLDSLARGIEDTFNGIVDFVSSIPDKIVEFFKGLGKKIGDTIGDIMPTVTWETVGIGPASIQVPHVEWFASGGIVDGAGVIGVGEAGPEAVVPLTPSRLRPFAQAVTAELATEGGGTTNYIINGLELTDDAQVRRCALDLFKALERKGRM